MTWQSYGVKLLQQRLFQRRNTVWIALSAALFACLCQWIVCSRSTVSGDLAGAADEDWMQRSKIRSNRRDAATARSNVTSIHTPLHQKNPSFASSHFPNGTIGYIADPKALRRRRRAFLHRQYQPRLYDKMDDDDFYFAVLTSYESDHRRGTLTENVSLSSSHVCSFAPGQGFEEEGGFKLLTEKIRIYAADVSKNEHDTSSIRILCSIYTHRKMRDLARTAALSWGYKCDGFLAFSDETIDALGILTLVHEGPEAYGNMWQKTRSIWAYIHQHYLADYDYFHLGGDDMYVIVENLRRFLTVIDNNTAVGKPVYLGQWIRQKNRPYVSGGPGYTLNRAALEQFIKKALPTCHAGKRASYEDRLLSLCMNNIGILPNDTRDYDTGEQRYHDCSPHCLYTSRAASGRRASFHSRAVAYWETLPHPDQDRYPNKTVGPKQGLEAASTYSVSFHKLYHPLCMARIHAILYPQSCPAGSRNRGDVDSEFKKREKKHMQRQNREIEKN